MPVICGYTEGSTPNDMRSVFQTTRPSRQLGFSLVEILVVICALALLSSIVLLNFGSQRSAVTSAKLRSDVTVLNSAVKVYLADGGELIGVTTYDEVLRRLKTKSSAEFARRHVGTVTGRFIDPRLAARELTASEASTNAPRAVWNAAQQEFLVVTTGSGIGSFYFDDSKLDDASVEENRQRSAMLFNRADGWVWEWGDHGGAAPASPVSFALHPSDPLEPLPPGTAPPPPPVPVFVPPPPPQPLPPPTILPLGGEFTRARFPASISIFANGAPADHSVLQYRIDDGAWTPYTAGFPVTPGSKVYAKNVALDRALYLDSPEDMETYLLLIHLFTGSLTPKWVGFEAKNNLTSMIDNANLDAVKTEYGHATQNLDSPNTLEFKRLGIVGVPPDTDFKLGDLTFFNGTVAFGTEATAVHLALNLQLLSPTAQAGSVAVPLSLKATPDPKDPIKSADGIQLDNRQTDFVVQADGMTYTLHLRFANITAEQGWTDGTTLHVFEGVAGRADLIGRFVTQ